MLGKEFTPRQELEDGANVFETEVIEEQIVPAGTTLLSVPPAGKLRPVEDGAVATAFLGIASGITPRVFKLFNTAAVTDSVIVFVSVTKSNCWEVCCTSCTTEPSPSLKVGS